MNVRIEESSGDMIVELSLEPQIHSSYQKRSKEFLAWIKAEVIHVDSLFRSVIEETSGKKIAHGSCRYFCKNEILWISFKFKSWSQRGEQTDLTWKTLLKLPEACRKKYVSEHTCWTRVSAAAIAKLKLDEEEA